VCKKYPHLFVCEYSLPKVVLLVQNFSYLTCTNRTATFANSETEVLVHCNLGDEINSDGEVVARHNHFNTVRKNNFAGNISGAEIELRTIFVVEWSVTSTFFFFSESQLQL